MALRANIRAATEDSGNLVYDFTRFIEESNVLDTAVAIIIGNAFKGITDSFVNDIMAPFLTSIFGDAKTRLEDRYYVIGKKDASDFLGIKDAERSGAQIVRYGKFIQVILQFLLQALVIFFIIRLWTRAKGLGARGLEFFRS